MRRINITNNQSIMKHEVKIPEGVKVTTIDWENRVVVFEKSPSDKIKEMSFFEPGRWYESDINSVILVISEAFIVGFNGDGEWFENDVSLVGYEDYWKPIPLHIVIILLNKEAMKRGYKKGIRCNAGGDYGIHYSETSISEHGFYMGAVRLLDFETGKWAEIIEEPKTYTNRFDTTFKEGDKFCRVNKTTLKLFTFTFTSSVESPFESADLSEIMTEKECYQWIADNYDKLIDGRDKK